jgi:DNA-directed RNA polymerase specialized sigma subunit
MANEYLNNRSFESIILAFQFFKRQKVRCEMIINDMKESHLRRSEKYKDEAKKPLLDSAIADYNETCVNFKTCQDQLAYAFYVLSENIANYAKFSGIDIDDAIQEGVLICFEKVDRFNPNYQGKSGQKAKAFNYMTTCILNHFRQLYRSARNYNELKKRYHNFLADNFESMVIRNGKERNNSKSSIDREANFW